MKQTRPRFDFRYIHHKGDIENTRKLENYVIRNEENTIISRQKQEIISINVRNCSYFIYLIYKQISKYESDEYDFVLNIFNDIHSHLMIINSLRYKTKYVKTLLEFLFVIKLNKSL